MLSFKVNLWYCSRQYFILKNPLDQASRGSYQFQNFMTHQYHLAVNFWCPCLSTEKFKGYPVADDTAEWIVNPRQFDFTCWHDFIPTRYSPSFCIAVVDIWTWTLSSSSAICITSGRKPSARNKSLNVLFSASWISSHAFSSEPVFPATLILV